MAIYEMSKNTSKYSAGQRKTGHLNFDFTKTLPSSHAVNFNCTVTSHGLFESLFSQLQNALSFESKAAHLRSSGHGKEKRDDLQPMNQAYNNWHTNKFELYNNHKQSLYITFLATSKW